MPFFNVKKINKDVLKIDNKLVNKNNFLLLHQEVTQRNYLDFFDQLKNETSIDPSLIKPFVDDLALQTQICIKGSKMLYLHGFVLYTLLTKYINDNPNIDFINILETGTARGFSAICMAKALHDSNQKGKIYTIDIIPNNLVTYWNCINDFNGPVTRPNLLSKWKDLCDNYIEFLSGDSKIILEKLSTDINRVHFSFLDAHHDYEYLNYELEFVSKKIEQGDIIICDDYTFYNNGSSQYPGIIKAIDEYISKYKSEYKIYYGSDGTKKRGYVSLKKV